MNQPLLDRTEIIKLFEELGRELESRGTRAEVFLVGGAAISLAYDTRRATRDVDAVFQPSASVRDAARVVAGRHELAEDWLNDAVKGFLPGTDPDARAILDRPGIRVDVASPRYLLAMKLMAAREEDVDDILLLYRECGFHSAKQGLDLVEAAYPGRPVPVRVQYLLEECFPVE
jgi:hypothetical protein